jgi:hypothetical protein
MDASIAANLDKNGAIKDPDCSVFPIEVPGINAYGVNDVSRVNDPEAIYDPDPNFARVQSVSFNASLARNDINALGFKLPVYKSVQMPIQVTTEITAESQYECEVVRWCHQTIDDKLEWRWLSDCRFELMTPCEGSNDLPNIVIGCCTPDYVITIDGNVIEVSPDLIKQLCNVVRQQHKLREKHRVLTKTLPKIQSIK